FHVTGVQTCALPIWISSGEGCVGVQPSGHVSSPSDRVAVVAELVTIPLCDERQNSHEFCYFLAACVPKRTLRSRVPGLRPSRCLLTSSPRPDGRGYCLPPLRGYQSPGLLRLRHDLHLAGEAAGGGDVGLTDVVHHLPVGVEPPAERADRTLHPPD